MNSSEIWPTNWSLNFLFAIFVLSVPLDSAFAQVLAKVGTATITVKEFNERYKEVQEQSINPPNKKLFLEDLIRYQIGILEAQKQNLQNDPVVKERFRQELYKALIEKSISDEVNKIKVTEKEMRDFYKKNPELRTSHILIEFKAGATPQQKEAAKKRALAIYSKVKASDRPFERLVELYTDDSISKNTGGDIGYQSKVTLVPPYYEAALKMKVGQISGLIETRYGFHILKLTGRRTFEQANKRQIRAAVFDQKRKVIFDRFFAQLKKKYPVKIDQSVFRKIQ